MNAAGPGTKAPRGKRQFLVHIDANLIRSIKILALDRDVTASSLVQEALQRFLATAAASSSSHRKPEESP